MFSRNFLLNLWVGSEILLTMTGCDRKIPHAQKFYYGDKVKVTQGFYKNVIGKVVDYGAFPEDNLWIYYIQFDENKSVSINENDLVKVWN